MPGARVDADGFVHARDLTPDELPGVEPFVPYGEPPPMPAGGYKYHGSDGYAWGDGTGGWGADGGSCGGDGGGGAGC